MTMIMVNLMMINNNNGCDGDSEEIDKDNDVRCDGDSNDDDDCSGKDDGDEGDDENSDES